ncbi:MAG: hypothetical protein FJW31_09710 [Acidobacteria bacterium]|nr:hypothetical protein [Acidobacteriota bacterium]
MSTAAPPLLHPIAVDDRINSLDVLRGFALLGILLMNILDFGLPNPAYNKLRLWGGDQGANVWVFVAQYMLAEGKMRALFSMMFGASIMLLTERGVDAAAVSRWLTFTFDVCCGSWPSVWRMPT